MTTFHTITMPDGLRLVVNMLDVVSMQEVTGSNGLDRGVCMRMRNGDSYLIKDAHRDHVDDLLSSSQGYPDREQY